VLRETLGKKISALSSDIPTFRSQVSLLLRDVTPPGSPAAEDVLTKITISGEPLLEVGRLFYYCYSENYFSFLLHYLDDRHSSLLLFLLLQVPIGHQRVDKEDSHFFRGAPGVVSLSGAARQDGGKRAAIRGTCCDYDRVSAPSERNPLLGCHPELGEFDAVQLGCFSVKYIVFIQRSRFLSSFLPPFSFSSFLHPFLEKTNKQNQRKETGRRSCPVIEQNVQKSDRLLSEATEEVLV